jgi:two-component system cell cycle response regulator DivK
MSLVLIVEDNERNLKLARDVLQAKGYDTMEAGTGVEGVQLAKQRKPDLVLMDIQLPGMSGIDAFKQLRADPQTARIPVIALTASVTPSDRSQITAAGFDAFVGKPINLREFVAAVKRLLHSARP